MSKMRKLSKVVNCVLLFHLFTFSLLAVSCSSDDDGYQSRLRELLMEDMSFTWEGGTQEQEYRHENLSVYKVSNKESWCSSRLDINNSKLVVTVKANTTYDARTDTVTQHQPRRRSKDPGIRTGTAAFGHRRGKVQRTQR